MQTAPATAKQFDQYEIAGILTDMLRSDYLRSSFWGEEFRCWVHNRVGLLRCYLRADDREAFMDCLQRGLERDCDYMMEFLEMLYERMGLDPEACWEEFEAIVSF